jgi:tetratricopeptide (TPR) repeat protein
VKDGPILRGLALLGVIVAGACIAVLIRPAPAERVADTRERRVELAAPQLEESFADALAALAAGDARSAEASFTTIVDRAPWLVEAHVNRGFALLILGRPRRALHSFRKALSLRPHQANAYYGLGVAHDLLGERPDALGAMRTFIHLAPPRSPHVRRARAALWEWQAGRDDVVP